MVQLLHLCGIIYNLQNQDRSNRFELRVFVCKSPFSRITSACAADLKKNNLKLSRDNKTVLLHARPLSS